MQSSAERERAVPVPDLDLKWDDRCCVETKLKSCALADVLVPGDAVPNRRVAL